MLKKTAGFIKKCLGAPWAYFRLKKRNEYLERTLELVAKDPLNAWLYRNRLERMDANLDIFDAARRKFHLARYEFAATKIPQDVPVGDIACGTGYGAGLIVKQVRGASVVGVDIDSEAIEYATQRYGSTQARFLCKSGDATGLPDASLGAIVSFETIEHVPDDLTLLAEFTRLLKPGGVLVCSTPNNWPLAIAPYHVREYTLQSFRTVLERHFEILEMFNQNSGTDSIFNHQQPAGITPTLPNNSHLAECLIAVCRKRS